MGCSERETALFFTKGEIVPKNNLSFDFLSLTFTGRTVRGSKCMKSDTIKDEATFQSCFEASKTYFWGSREVLEKVATVKRILLSLHNWSSCL